MDGTTTMKPRVLVAAVALLALAGSIGPMASKLRAAEEEAPLPAAAASSMELPRFEPQGDPAPADFAEGIAALDGVASSAVVQPLPEEDAEAEAMGSGVASWYGREFAGRKTASGERFDPTEYTAAHRTLPFGSKVRVSRGGKSVIVRINDRGPFHGNRVIDLSRAAAAELGLVSAGSGRVDLALLNE